MKSVCLLIAHRNVALTPGSLGFLLFCKMKSMKSVDSHLFKDIMQTKKDSEKYCLEKCFVAMLFSFLTICVLIPRPFTIPQVLRPKGQEEGQETEEEDEEEEEEVEKERTKVTFSWSCIKI